jgi:hypothetical protein
VDIAHELINLYQGDTTRIPQSNSTSVKYSMSFSVQNVHDTAIVYIGTVNVSDSNYGIKLIPNAIASFDNVPKNASFYATTDTNGSQVAVLKMSM